MSKEQTETVTAPKISKKQAKNWRVIRELSLWFVIALQIAFFAGTFVGGMWERNHTNEINSVKEAAVQQLKALEQK